MELCLELNLAFVINSYGLKLSSGSGIHLETCNFDFEFKTPQNQENTLPNELLVT